MSERTFCRTRAQNRIGLRVLKSVVFHLQRLRWLFFKYSVRRLNFSHSCPSCLAHSALTVKCFFSRVIFFVDADFLINCIICHNNNLVSWL